VDPTWIFEVWPQLIRSSFSQLFTWKAWKAGLKTVNKQSKFDKFMVLKTVEKIRQHYPPLYKHNIVTVTPEILIHFVFLHQKLKDPQSLLQIQIPRTQKISVTIPPRSVKATRRSLSYYSIFVVRSLKPINAPDR
jgi:sRNA-binding regulator protein Hfq